MLVFLFAFLCIATINSQERDVQVYKSFKKYNPNVAGVSSLFISGLGQIYCGETKRGLKFMGGSFLSIASIMGGFVNEAFSNKTSVFTAVGIVAYAVVKTWAIEDAVSLAKEKNLRNEQYLRLSFKPVSFLSKSGSQSLGVGLVVSF